MPRRSSLSQFYNSVVEFPGWVSSTAPWKKKKSWAKQFSSEQKTRSTSYTFKLAVLILVNLHIFIHVFKLQLELYQVTLKKFVNLLVLQIYNA